jgi:hypothetical protein
MAAAAVVAVVSAAGPLSAAQDTATAALLAAMHLITGAAFLAAAARVKRTMTSFIREGRGTHADKTVERALRHRWAGVSWVNCE